MDIWQELEARNNIVAKQRVSRWLREAAMKFEEYETRKAEIRRTSKTEAEYERRIKKLVEELRI